MSDVTEAPVTVAPVTAAPIETSAQSAAPSASLAPSATVVVGAPASTPTLNTTSAPISAAPIESPVESPVESPAPVETPVQPVATPTLPVPTPTAPVGTNPPTQAPVLAPTPIPYLAPIMDPDRSMSPHKQNLADTAGNFEKEAVDSLNGAEIFGITAGVLVFMCIVGFCFGRRWANWCQKRRGSHLPTSGVDESAPFSAAEQEML